MRRLPVRTLLAMLLLAVSGAAMAAAPPTVIRLASPDATAGKRSSSGTPMVDYAYVNRLFEREFEKDGIKVQWAFFKNAGPAVNEAFANGQIDIAFLGDFAAIIGESVGNETRLLAAASRGLNGYLGVVPGSGHDGWESLRGKTLGVWLGTASQLSMDAVMAAHGYSQRDFRVVSLDGGAALAALAARRVDAIWSAAGLLAMKRLGLAEIPLSTQDGDGAGTIALTMLGATSFVEQHPEIVARLVRVLVQAAHWASEPQNETALLELMTTQTTLPPEVMAEELQGKPLALRNSPLLDPYVLNHLRYGARAALEARLIRRPIDVDAWVEPRFLNEALETLGLQDYWPEQEAYVDPWQ